MAARKLREKSPAIARLLGNLKLIVSRLHSFYTRSVLARVGTGKSSVIPGASTRRENKSLMNGAALYPNLKLLPPALKQTVHQNGKPAHGQR